MKPRSKKTNLKPKRTKRAKRPVDESSKPQSPGLTPYENEEIKKRLLPLDQMIANGKSRDEAVLLFLVNRLVESEAWRDDPDWCDFEKLDEKEKAKLRSLKALAQQIMKYLRRAAEHKSYFEKILGPHNETLTEYCNRFFADETRLISTVQEVWMILKRRPKLRRSLDELVFGRMANHQELCLVIGFCLGMRAYKTALKRHLDIVTTTNLEAFNIRFPDPSGEAIIQKAGII